MNKKHLSLLILLLVATLLCSCGENEANPTIYNDYTKIADNLYEVTCNDYDINYLFKDGRVNDDTVAACSAIKAGNYLGRNFDFIIGDAAEVVVKVPAKEGRYASVGISASIDWLTTEFMDAGLDEDAKKLIPIIMMDGINEKGLAVEINCVNTKDVGGVTKETNPGKEKLPVLGVIRYLLDNAASATEAIELLKSVNIVETPRDVIGLTAVEFEVHFMITDKNKTYVVEFDNNKPEGEKLVILEDETVMTNFYNHLADPEKDKYPDNSMGIERYRKLVENKNSVNSVDTMKKLMQSIKYSNSYRLDGEYAPGKNYDNPYTCFSDYSSPDGKIFYANYKEHMDEVIEGMKIEEEETKKVLADPELKNPHSLWATSHSSVYDLEKLTLSVAVYERFDKYYDFSVNGYIPNKEITGDYDKSLAAKCKNGTFVGNSIDDVKIWKGIPYAKQPTGNLRFKPTVAAEPSNKIYEAYHFMRSAMQSFDPDELASAYEQGEDCLGLNVWSSNKSSEEAKPVFVFIHGGGWMAGGTQDPLYNGYFFAKNNPDILVVSVDYRLGMLGQIDLSSLPDGKDYDDSEALCMLDIIQSLKWVKENIEAFGGNPKNVTICGESAGAGAVSLLCVMPEAKGLFSKAIPMSGSVAQYASEDFTKELLPALCKKFDCKTVSDLQKIPFDKLKDWWELNCEDVYHHPVRGLGLIEEDPFDAWKRGDSKDITILQGNTKDEFRYYRVVFGNVDEMFDAVCEGSAKHALENSDKEYTKEFEKYKTALEGLGYSDKEIYREYEDDHCFDAGNIYQEEMHAKNGGKGFAYTFEKTYDGDYEYLSAAHAVDCYYLFGTFDGEWAFGNDKEVELSLKFQEMIANFCKTGNPSIDGADWPEYDNESRNRIMIGENFKVEKNYENDRVDCIMRMMEISDAFRYVDDENKMIEYANEINPEAVKKCKEVWHSAKQ